MNNPFDDITGEVIRLKQHIAQQDSTISSTQEQHEKALDDICLRIITAIDSYDKADARLAERYPDDDTVAKARQRFATVRKRLCDLLQQLNVEEITFPDAIANDNDCKVVDTIPDAQQRNGTIVSIDKSGYRRTGRLLRVAEVVIVKNNS